MKKFLPLLLLAVVGAALGGCASNDDAAAAADPVDPVKDAEVKKEVGGGPTQALD